MYSAKKHGDNPEDYENYIHANVLPTIKAQNRRRQLFESFKQGLKSAAKNVAIGFSVAAIALAGAHIVGLHLMGLHAIRTAHFLVEVAMGLGAVSLGVWIDEKTMPTQTLSQQVAEKDDKKALRKSAPELNRESSGREDTSFSFKSFFVKMRRRFSSPDLMQTASNDYDLKRLDGKR